MDGAPPDRLPRTATRLMRADDMRMNEKGADGRIAVRALVESLVG
jgi:hypothetical protein